MSCDTISSMGGQPNANTQQITIRQDYISVWEKPVYLILIQACIHTHTMYTHTAVVVAYIL
jgi:hypothetical protein